MDCEWIVVSDCYEYGCRKILQGSDGTDTVTDFNINMEHFFKPENEKIPQRPAKPKVMTTQLAAVPFQLNPTPGTGRTQDNDHDIDGVKEVIKFPIEIKFPPTFEGDREAASQVFFNEKMENKFVDMKKDVAKANSRVILPQFDSDNFPSDEKSGFIESRDGEAISPRKEDEKDQMMAMMNRHDNSISDVKEEADGDGSLNIWKLSTAGIGALCSMGVAAATLCILIFGRAQQTKQTHNLRFHMYTDDKRIKQVVHHANKLNEAISAARGVPLARAQITFGGYYDGL